MKAKAWVTPVPRTRFDFYLSSEVTRRTDGFQLIELGKL